MSYILDALRKSDQQRQRGATPTLLTAQAPVAEPKPSEYWVYGLIAAVLVGAGILMGWLHPWQPEPIAARPPEGTPASREAIAPPAPGQTAASASPAPAPSSPDLSRGPVQPAPVYVPPAAQAVPASPPAPMAQAAPSASIAEPRASVPKPMPAVQAAQAPAKPAIASQSEPAQEARVMTLGELPASIVQELPAMQISLHLHSTKAANRFVSINNQMLQEGAYAAPGLKLEQITPEGMVFSYKGYRFRRGVQ